MQPKVSIIVPVYNKEATLARSLESVLRQSLQDFEVIIVDDGSPDNAGAIADEYAHRDARITVIHQENRGAAEARKTGQRAARGAYRMHLDSDDTLPDDALEILYNTAQNNECDMVYSGFNRIDGTTISTSPVRQIHGVHDAREVAALMLDPDFVYYAGMCFSSERLWQHDLDKIFPPATPRLPAEDIIINFNLVFKAQRIALIDTPTYNYYNDPQSLTSTGTFFKQDLFHRFFDELEHVLNAAGMPDEVFRKVDIMKLSYLSLYVNPIDVSDPWVSNLLSIPRNELPRKYKLFQVLLPHNRLRRSALQVKRTANRLLKRT